jgi:hypothetical protein
MVWLFGILPLKARLRKAARKGDGFGATGSLKNIDD